MIYTPIKQAITPGSYVAVRLPTNCSCSAFSLWSEDGASYSISSLSDGSDAITVPNGFPLSVDQSLGKKIPGAIICYARGTTSTNLVGLITR